MNVAVSKPVQKGDISKIVSADELYILGWAFCHQPGPCSPLGQHTLLDLSHTLQYSLSYCLKTTEEKVVTTQAENSILHFSGKLN